MKKDDPAIKKEREQAWTGDAVLALFARTWILEQDQQMNGEKFIRFTSNEFLRRLGNPTTEEAKIGIIYQNKGLQAAFAHIETYILPKFIEIEKSRVKQRLK